jgi:ribokinase
MDLVARVTRFPVAGETVLGAAFATHPGGKGANQAVAAARLGGQVKFVGKFGEDPFGDQLVASLEESRVDTSPSWRSMEPTGTAMITVDESGQNQIVVALGANADLHPGDVRRSIGELEEAPLVCLAQLEIPIKSALSCFLECQGRGTQWRILNPAPAAELSSAMYRAVNVITPNEHEAETMTGQTDPEKASSWFHEAGVEFVAITLGPAGVFVSCPDLRTLIPAKQVDVVDTTAAGDCFAGALAYGLAEGGEFAEACEFACRAASISVTRHGAQPSMPVRSDLYR